MERKYRVHIGTSYSDPLSSALWLIEDRNGKTYVAKPAELTMVEHKEGEECPPTLRFSVFEMKDILLAFAKALEKQGIETDSEAKIKGLLEATKYHLDDMRKLLKLK